MCNIVTLAFSINYDIAIKLIDMLNQLNLQFRRRKNPICQKLIKIKLYFNKAFPFFQQIFDKKML